MGDLDGSVTTEALRSAFRDYGSVIEEETFVNAGGAFVRPLTPPSPIPTLSLSLSLSSPSSSQLSDSPCSLSLVGVGGWDA